ncbi:Enoyl-CoA hydratase/isomerase [Emticicia oligotrophica DSM 17448]|uniref:Enoyl-CoA hydratase/isomerase n=1 Tax=Emticicia oligotrophica (strain DSM 17448 / CIP 109782 / MTCC 6937 / GPTSA100-15) TaxID=929562 RepID=A0ABN4ARJ4_EMTOG|nr:enoyl-CoA hydratase-related protein [Emticicia oligotrophica]AFK05159.1 Enoyl-CoA hydratase/isomerase [Emticicia oligotrophica DSM 17448]
MFFQESDLSKFSEVEFKLIKVNKSGNLFTITLNRPEKRNAFTPIMLTELAYALAYAHYHSEVWCVLLKAEGPAFCAGMDLNVFQNPSLDIENLKLPKPIKEVTIGDAFKYLEKPCIAQVEGSVFAGGFLLIGGCSFVVSVEDAQFGLPEVKRGIFPMQVMATLLKIMPQRKAMEMAILGKNYTAQEAFNLGIVTHICSKENIENEANQLVESILENSPFAIRKGFEAINQLNNLSEVEQHQYLLSVLQEIRQSEDAREGILAFKEKRKPVWKNK